MSPKVLQLSVIIPVVNEYKNLTELLPYLSTILSEQYSEVILVDGGSSDGSLEYAQSQNVLLLKTEKASRAMQMNTGAQQAKGVGLYFLHADTRPPLDLEALLLNAIQNQVAAGCFRYVFDSSKKILAFNSWFTRFNGLFAGGGDQSLFIQKDVFEGLGGFDEHFCIMEDFDLVRRLKMRHKLHIFSQVMKVSARKYEKNSWIKVQYANFLAFYYFKTNRSPEKIKAMYRFILRSE